LDERAIVEKIKQIRRNKRITLKDLAGRTGLTEGYLSRIENAENAPPISTLSRIARGLAIDVSYLLLSTDGSEKSNPNIVVHKRSGVGELHASGTPHQKRVYGYQYEPLAHQKRGKNMEPYILVPDFEPGEVLHHEGEEFLYVLTGAIEFFYGTESHILRQGDSAYFDAHIPHNGRSLGKEKAWVLIIIYPYKRM
jgi:transcriptional regulator with XRE-family HTH domain